MLNYLKIKNIGIFPQLEVNFAPRLNFLVGANGSGKTFLLDLAWWVLTQSLTQYDYDFMPYLPTSKAKAKITYQCKGESKKVKVYDKKNLKWTDDEISLNSKIVILYAQTNGNFLIWDSVAQVLNDFTLNEVWNDLILEKSEEEEILNKFEKILEILSSNSIKLELPQTKQCDDVLVVINGQHIPLGIAPASIRRLVSLAYLLVLVCHSKLKFSLVLLLDEAEAHLDPQTQRTLLKGLLAAIKSLNIPSQIILTTHSPLILASAEPIFDPKQDTLFNLNLKEQQDFIPHGDVSNWLTSTFNLKDARSLEAEMAIEKARALLQKPITEVTREEQKAVDEELRRAGLSDIDPFWVRWGMFMEEK
jgi:predicted ATPase